MKTETNQNNAELFTSYFSAVILIATLLLLAAVTARGQAFPPIGADSGPGIILTINANGTLTVTRTNQPPYDSIEDTYVGVINNSAQTICSIRLQSPNPIFAFDGDGICGNDSSTGMPFNPRPGGCPFLDPNLYGGPMVSFSNINATATAGNVNFNGGLGPNQSTYFGLEEAIETTCDPVPGVVRLSQGCGHNTCPTPPSTCAAKAWSCVTYDHDSQSTDTIGKWGCNLTSCTMLVNYYASSQGVTDPTTHQPFLITPDVLNAWLNTQSDGWTTGGGPNRYTVARFARTLGGLVTDENHGGIKMWYQGDAPFKVPTGCQSSSATHTCNDFDVDNYLCSLNPVILWVAGTSHYVVAYGQVSGPGKYLIQDPGYSTRTDLSAYQSKYDGMFPFSSTSTPPQALLITAHSPVELVITDPAGHKTGIDPSSNQTFDEIPNSSYTVQTIKDDDDPTSGQMKPATKVFDLPIPTDGTYRVKALGTGMGSFKLDFVGYDAGGSASLKSINGTAHPGSVTEFKVDYSSSPGSQIAVTPVVVAKAAIDAEPPVIKEGQTALFRISLTGADPSQPTTVNFSMSGNAILGTHYTLSEPTNTLIIPAGVSTGRVFLTALRTTLRRGSEVATMTIQPGDGYTVSNRKRANITIRNR